MVGHEAIGPAGNAVGAAALGEQVAVKRIVTFFDEQFLAPVAALGDVMGKTGSNDAGDARHERDLQPGMFRGFVSCLVGEVNDLGNWYHVTVIARNCRNCNSRNPRNP